MSPNAPFESPAAARPDLAPESDFIAAAVSRLIQQVRPAWGPRTEALVSLCRSEMEALAAAPAPQPWAESLFSDGSSSRELYRDADAGFVLTAHLEPDGLFRAPHDHGRSWVVYAVQSGAIVMRTYTRVESAEGVRLVKRDEAVLCAGQAQAFLPGDIHDTRALSGPAVLLRFTERDLKREDQVERRVTRYVERDGLWTTGPV